MRVGGAGIEPDDVVPLGGVLPERVGREGAHVHRRGRIERPADPVQPEADDAAVLGQPVHVVLRMTRVRHQADPLEPVRVALQAAAEISVGVERGAADLHQRRLLDGVLLHQAQELLGALLLPIGRHGIADLSRELARGLGEDVDVGVDHEAGLPISSSSLPGSRQTMRRAVPSMISARSSSPRSGSRSSSTRVSLP